jgi:DNA-binding transcriptional MerR regulator
MADSPAKPQMGEGRGSARAERRLYKTADVVKKSGFSRQMIYAYTTMGLITEAEKTPTGHKLYDETVFVKLKLIHDLHESGYTLRDIKQIFFK